MIRPLPDERDGRRCADGMQPLGGLAGFVLTVRTGSDAGEQTVDEPFERLDCLGQCRDLLEPTSGSATFFGRLQRASGLRAARATSCPSSGSSATSLQTNW